MPRRYDRWFAAYGPAFSGWGGPWVTRKVPVAQPFNNPGPTGFNNPGPRMIVNQVHPTRLPITPAGGVRDIYRQAQSGIYDDGGGPKGGRFVGQGIYRQWLPE